jgi:DNA-binding NarL/FixJ family response regulator
VTSSASVALGQQRSRGLTRREREVLLVLYTGASNKGIAQELRLSVATVKHHVHSIFRKTGARRRSDLVAQMATRSGAA